MHKEKNILKYSIYNIQYVQRAVPTRSELTIFHDVVLGGNNLSTSTASLAKAWSTFSTGGSSITIDGSTVTFAKVVLMLEGGTTNSKTEFVFVVCSRDFDDN